MLFYLNLVKAISKISLFVRIDTWVCIILNKNKVLRGSRAGDTVPGGRRIL
jgi:hypothetical protein